MTRKSTNLSPTSGNVNRSDGSWLNIADYFDGALNDFGEIRMAQRYPQLTLNAGLPISERRDYTLNSANGGGVELVDGEYRVFATATAGSVGSTFTRQRANYLSGGVLEGGIGIRIPVQPTGNAQVNWGFIEYDRSTAVQFSYQSTGVRLQIINNGVLEVDVPQSEWNIDPLDGSGSSKAVLDMSTGYVTQIPIIYYGYGDIRFQVMTVVNGRKRVIDIHRERRDGQISIDNANLPLGIEVIGDGTALEAFVGGRQVNSTFEDNIPPRYTSGRRIGQSVGTDFVPLVSFRIKTGFEDIFCNTFDIEVSTDTDLIVELRRGGTLTGDTFNYVGNYSESERALEYDIAATAITGGEMIYDTFAIGGAGNRKQLRPANLQPRYISEFDTTTVVARTISGTATVNTIVRNAEKW